MLLLSRFDYDTYTLFSEFIRSQISFELAGTLKYLSSNYRVFMHHKSGLGDAFYSSELFPIAASLVCLFHPHYMAKNNSFT